jgi:hypothetical protein
MFGASTRVKFEENLKEQSDHVTTPLMKDTFHELFKVIQPRFSFTLYGTFCHFQTFSGIKKNVKTKPINTVDIYQLMCHVLRITPSANDGIWSHVDDILADKFENAMEHSNNRFLSNTC